MKVKFDENLARDYVECWGMIIYLPKTSLFAQNKKDREKIIKEKILNILKDLGIEEAEVSFVSAWIRYYVFKIKAEKDFALLILSPNSPIKSFKKEIPKEIVNLDFVAKPILIDDEFVLQEWISATPLSEFRDGFILKRECKEAIELASYELWIFNELGYIYTPWEDFEVCFDGSKLIFLDLTRFVKKKLRPIDFFQFYFGVPFSSPEIIRGEKQIYRLYWRGVSEKDYFGTSKKEYVELFLKGLKKASERAYEEVINMLSKTSEIPTTCIKERTSLK